MSSFDLREDFESSLSLQSSTNSRSFDFDGLEESLVDESDDTDDRVTSKEQSFHAIRNALIRDSENRSEEDLDLIQDFLELISKHNSLKEKDHQTKRLLAKHMVLAEIEARDTRVLTDGERLDAYCVVACGSLRHVMPSLDSCVDCLQECHHNRVSSLSSMSSSVRYLLVGDEFGAQLDDRTVFGEIFTNQDFVWVLCVPHVIFDEICGKKSFKTLFDEKNEKVLEIRNQLTNELIKCSKERLLELLLRPNPDMSDDSDDTQFISDFLLTFRLFFGKDCVKELIFKLKNQILSEKSVEKCLKIILFWISNHFQDFKHEKHFFQDLETVLKSKIHKKLFYFALSSKSRARHVTLTRSLRQSELPFALIGGYQSGTRLFVHEILRPEECPEVTRGDRLLDINGVDCHVMEVTRAEALLKASTHLSLHLQFDPHLYHMLLDGQISRNSSKSSLTTTPTTPKETTPRDVSSQSMTSFATLKSIPSLQYNYLTNLTSSGNFQHWRQKVLKIVRKDNQKNNNNNNNQQNGTLERKSAETITPEVIKIHFENDFRYLPILGTTSARECIQLALIEFQLNSNYSSRDFALYEYKSIDSTTGTTSVVKRLSDNHQNLAHNLSLNSRLYLKCISGREMTSHPSEAEITKETLKECHVNTLLTLDACEIARELFERDFSLFCRIESQQFIYDLNSSEEKTTSTTTTTPKDDRLRELKEFEEKTNQEMFWTINRVLFEGNSNSKRVKCVKQLIKIALICRQMHNFNALFAIISGLSHQSIQRMKTLFEKVPQKSLNKLKKLYKLMDPSKNFSEFRQQLRHCEPPIIPFFPLVKKDLSFIDLANPTLVPTEDRKCVLVNWEKMRLLGHKCREVQSMTTRVTTPTTETTTDRHHSLANHLKALNESKESNYRRIWEKQRMRKRVQHFLDKSFSEIICDENVLLEKSFEIEPQVERQSLDAKTTTPTTGSQRSSTLSSLSSSAVMPSPTLSSHSSSPSLSSSMSSNTTASDVQLSSQRMRFGLRDEFGLRKLLSLSDNCQPIGSHQTLPNGPLSQSMNANYISKTSLPEESSSVTSLRRLEAFQQMSRYREQMFAQRRRETMPQTMVPMVPNFGIERPLLPNYDQTIQRMKKKLNKSEENVV